METTNLSKTKTAFRTTGQITGNFGSPKVKAGYNQQLGLTDAGIQNITTQDAYLDKMYRAYQSTQDSKLKQFCFNEVKKILIQRGEWNY